MGFVGLPRAGGCGEDGGERRSGSGDGEDNVDGGGDREEVSDDASGEAILIHSLSIAAERVRERVRVVMVTVTKS